MKLLTVRHATTYRYDAPVTFGQHRLMLRPRDSHDLRLVGAELSISPHGTLHWMHDVFGNSVNDRNDLGRLLDSHYPDPRGIVEAWARHFILETPANTFNLLATMNAGIRGGFEYHAREEEGTQSPVVTIETKSGTCRDYALLFIEAARSLGFGARFVSGYLYDPALDGGDALQGAGATHAWADIYLPGAGWVEFDPTNGLIAGENLIRVAVTREPAQAVPISGSFFGEGKFVGMEVDVTVRAEAQ